MIKKATANIAAMALLICICQFSKALSTPANAGFDPAKLKISWTFIENNHDGKTGFLAALTFTNNNALPLPASGWSIYFSLRYHSIALRSQNDDLTITHIQGDLFCVKPAASFKGLNTGETISMNYTGGGKIANYQDVPSGLFWVDEHSNRVVKLRITVNPGTLKGADAEAIFDQNKEITDIPAAELPAVLPTPVSYKTTLGHFTWDKNIQIKCDDAFKKEGVYLQKEFQSLTGFTATGKGNRVVIRRSKLPEEAYRLQIRPDSILITAGDSAGAFYAIQSLKNLLPADVWHNKQASLTIPCADIEDRPRFPVRAFMLDVSRNFQSKQEILKLLDIMALYKLNVFHFHLTDDEGWRLQISGLPELTTVGAMRGYPFSKDKRLQPSYGSGPTTGDKMGSGYYTRADYIEILKYAQTRHIKVIPEIESPGHARAAVRSMLARYKHYIKTDRKKAEYYLLADLKDSSKYSSAQYFSDNVINPALPSSYHFIQKVLDEVSAMYKEAGAGLTMIHMGGDEVPNGTWEKSPAINGMMARDTTLHNVNDIFQHYFKCINTMLIKQKLKLYAWEELAVGTQKFENARQVVKIPEYLNNGVSVDAWYNVSGNESLPYQLANSDYKTVLTNIDFFYFDLAYQRSFHDPGDEWLGLLNTKKVLSFIPYNYYKNETVSMAGNPFPAGYFTNKEKLTDEGRRNITGIQGALWSENIRSTQQMEYMIVPRLLALAEKAWAAQPDWETDADSVRSTSGFQAQWNVFANLLGKRELPKLNYYHGGYNFMIPAPGIKQMNGQVQVNQQFPGMEMRYTMDGAEPTKKSAVYTPAVKLTGTIKMKVFDQRGRSSESTGIKAN